MEATRLIIPSFPDDERGFGEKNLRMGVRLYPGEYVGECIPKMGRRSESKRGDLGKQFVLSQCESTFDPWERVVHRGRPFLVPGTR